jgi:hypothetical protein
MLNKNLVGTNNVGYTIIKQGEQAVIAHNPNAFDKYVAWSYNYVNNEVSYFWGRYGTFNTATIAFNKKENNEYSG